MKALLTALVLPPGGPLILILLGLLLKRRWLIGLGLALALLLSTESVVDPLARAYAGSRPAAETLALAQDWRGRNDAVVLVLGAGVRAGAAPDGSYELKPLTAERLQRGLWWSRQLGLPLAFTGGMTQGTELNAPTEAAVVQKFLRERGEAEPIWLENQSRNTRENASLSAALFRKHGGRRLLLVTHALHMPRALKHFRAALPGVEILPAPLSRDPQDGPWEAQQLFEWLPSSQAAARGNYLAYEVAAMIAGR